ncbi:MAG: hypothetical protein HRF43_18565, partial [Phycisphaerae bacterium]
MAGYVEHYNTIRLHTPTDNAEIERYHRTVDERLAELEAGDYAAMSA